MLDPCWKLQLCMTLHSNLHREATIICDIPISSQPTSNALPCQAYQCNCIGTSGMQLLRSFEACLAMPSEGMLAVFWPDWGAETLTFDQSTCQASAGSSLKGALSQSYPRTIIKAGKGCRNTGQQPRARHQHSRPDQCRHRPDLQETRLDTSAEAGQPIQLKRLPMCKGISGHAQRLLMTFSSSRTG